MKFSILLALACLSSFGELISAQSPYNSAEIPARTWRQELRRTGVNEDGLERRTASSPLDHYLGRNQLSDSTQSLNTAGHEFLRSILNGSSPVPDEIDWRKHPNRVSPVIDQDQCRASFAIAAVGVLEGQQVIRGFSEKLEPLSVGQVVGCTIHSAHCYGGLPSAALRDVHLIGGIESAAEYPYVFSQIDCLFKPDKVVMKTAGVLDLPAGESVLKMVVGLYGPVAVQLHVNTQVYKYKSGVFDDASCDGTDLNQAMLVVGYGTDPKEGDYWILRNSWGTGWGENGYIRMRRGSARCGLGKISTIATF